AWSARAGRCATSWRFSTTPWSRGPMPTPDTPPLDLAAEVEEVFRVCASIAREARDTDNPKLALLAAQRVGTLADLIARMRGELAPGAQVAIHLAPEFTALQDRLLAILAPHPELRAQVARALLTSGDAR